MRIHTCDSDEATAVCSRRGRHDCTPRLLAEYSAALRPLTRSHPLQRPAAALRPCPCRHQRRPAAPQATALPPLCHCHLQRRAADLPPRCTAQRGPAVQPPAPVLLIPLRCWSLLRRLAVARAQCLRRSAQLHLCAWRASPAVLSCWLRHLAAQLLQGSAAPRPGPPERCPNIWGTCHRRAQPVPGQRSISNCVCS